MAFSQITDLIAILAAFLYVLAYFLLQLGVFRGTSVSYIVINLVAATLAAVSVIYAFNYATFLNAVFWILISLMGLYRTFRIHRSISGLSDEDRAFIAAKLSDLSDSQVSELMKNALWISGEAGVELTRQDEVNESLVYLTEGTAEVIVNDQAISMVKAGSFVGEATCMSGDPASATVRLLEPTRYLSLNSRRIREMSAKDVSLRQALELTFVADMKDKLVATNQKLVDQKTRETA